MIRFSKFVEPKHSSIGTPAQPNSNKDIREWSLWCNLAGPMFLRASLGRQVAFSTPLIAKPSHEIGSSSWCSQIRVTTAKLPLRKRLHHVVYALQGESSNTMKPANQRIGIIANVKTMEIEKSTSEQSSSNGGFLGVKAKAYWSTIGFLPLFFAGIGIMALGIKMLKVIRGQWSSEDGINRAMINESVITTSEQEADLHVFKCGGCGYEMYPARGREFKFFPDNFKCPLCGSPKSAFWDLNDPNDPRNQEFDDDDDDERLQHAGVPDPNLSGGAAPFKGDDGKKNI